MIVTIAAGKLERRSRKPFSSPLDLNCRAASIVKVKLVYLIDRFRLLRCWSLASYDRNNRSAFYFSDCRVWSNHSMEGRLQWSPVKKRHSFFSSLLGCRESLTEVQRYNYCCLNTLPAWLIYLQSVTLVLQAHLDVTCHYFKRDHWIVHFKTFHWLGHYGR